MKLTIKYILRTLPSSLPTGLSLIDWHTPPGFPTNYSYGSPKQISDSRNSFDKKVPVGKHYSLLSYIFKDKKKNLSRNFILSSFVSRFLGGLRSRLNLVTFAYVFSWTISFLECASSRREYIVARLVSVSLLQSAPSSREYTLHRVSYFIVNLHIHRSIWPLVRNIFILMGHFSQS